MHPTKFWVGFRRRVRWLSLAALAALGTLAACAPTLTPEGAAVRLISGAEGERCEALGQVKGLSATRAAHMGPEAASGINVARNRVAELGGDAMVVLEQDKRVFYGRGAPWYSTVAEAHRCG